MTFNLISLLLKTDVSYDKNLDELIYIIKEAKEYSIIVAPEVCITGFDYTNFEAAALYSQTILKHLLKISHNKIITLTLIEKEDEGFYNNAYVISNKQVIHKQAKHQLFKMGGETKYFKSGDLDSIKIFSAFGIKFAVLICFELRFKELWSRVEGADVILLPAQWGKIRSEHFKTLCKALAIMNECYVVASDANNSDTTALSAVIDPFGDVTYNNGLEAVYVPFEQSKIKKMRRYLDTGIK